MKDQSNNDDEEESFLKRHGVKCVVLIGVVATGVTLFFNSDKTESKPTKSKPTVVNISLPPLPPAPPPPPPPPPPPAPKPPEPEEQEMVEQTPIDEPEEKPEEAPAPADDPPPISTGIVGNGPGTLSTQGGGTGGGSRIGGKPRANNSKFGWYATQVQAKVSEAIRTHSRTRKSDMRLEIRIWSDANGRVTKANISGSTGDAGTDSAIKNEILTGMQLQEPPPADMPMPIVMRVTARRPN